MITFSQWGKMGRMGNMLFQAATVIGLARKNKDNFVLPNWSEEASFNLHNCFGTARATQTYTEKHFPYQELPSDTIGKVVDLVGYFQSWKYFDHCKDEIVKLLSPKHNYAKQDGVTGIHIRRGDYVGIQHCHPCLPKEYYFQAMEITKSSAYMVFSDDIPYCRQMFGNRSDVFYSEGRSPVDDLALLSVCENQIIANSSFSWWGAYLNTNPHKIVVSPNGSNYRWFGPSLPHDLKDLIPPGWLCL